MFVLWPSNIDALARVGVHVAKLESAGVGIYLPSMASTDKSHSKRRWSREVTRTSNALDLEGGVFTWEDPKRIARSLKRSAEASERRKAKPFQSAMSMLNLYINRAGSKLPASRKKILQQAKQELRVAFHRAGEESGS